MRLVARTLDVLELLAEHPDGLGVMKIAEVLGAAPSSVHRLLAVLAGRGYVVQADGSHRYRLGNAVLRLGQAYQHRNRLIAVATPYLAQLSARTLESVFLSELNRDHVICVASAESPRPLSFYMRIGARTPYHAASSARSILAFHPRDRQEALLQAEKMLRFTEFTPVTVADALAELVRTRERGYAICDQEMENGITALSAPIRTENGEVTASLTLVAPQDRLAGDARDLTARLLIDTASAISRDLGFSQEVSDRSAAPVATRVAAAARTRATATGRRQASAESVAGPAGT